MSNFSAENQEIIIKTGSPMSGLSLLPVISDSRTSGLLQKKRADLSIHPWAF